MKKISSLIVVLLTTIMLFSCGSGADGNAKKKEKAQYQKGNLYGYNGRQIGVDDILDSLIRFDITGITATVMHFQWFKPKEFWIFTETEGEGNGFYTGVKEAGGPVYTWSAHKVSVSSLYQMCQVIGWTKPVYITYENKTIPLTVYEDENGELKSAVGLSVDNPIYVSLDTIKHADIWYCYGMGNDIKNQYYKLSSYGVAIGECAKAQAEANGLLLKDIARLTGAKQGLSETDTDVELTDEDIAVIVSKINDLDETIKEKIKINRDLTNAVGGAIAASINEGIRLAGIIALDVADVAAHALDPEWIAAYIIRTYGATKEIQAFGKMADKQAKANFDYGKKLMESSQDLLKKQKAQFNSILGEDK